MKLQRVAGFVEYKFSSNIVKAQLVKSFSVGTLDMQFQVI